MFHIEVAGDTIVERELMRFGERVAALEPVYLSIAEDLRQIEGFQFSTEGAHGSGGWAPLSDSTVKEKARMGYPSEILQRTGALMGSLTSEGAEGSILTVTPEGMRFGTSISYAGYHQHGTSKMPERKVMELAEWERIALVKKVQEFIVKGVVVPL